MPPGTLRDSWLGLLSWPKTPLRVFPGVVSVATLLRLYTERPSLDGGARGYPPREGGNEGDSGGEVPDLALKRFPGVERDSADRLLEFWPPTCIWGDPEAGAELPEA